MASTQELLIIPRCQLLCKKYDAKAKLQQDCISFTNLCNKQLSIAGAFVNHVRVVSISIPSNALILINFNFIPFMVYDYVYTSIHPDHTPPVQTPLNGGRLSAEEHVIVIVFSIDSAFVHVVAMPCHADSRCQAM